MYIITCWNAFNLYTGFVHISDQVICVETFLQGLFEILGPSAVALQVPICASSF